MQVQNGLSVACASNESTWKRRPDWVPILALRLGGDHTVGESQEFSRGNQPVNKQCVCTIWVCWNVCTEQGLAIKSHFKL